MNPFLTLNYELALESLGNDYSDEVQAAEFPQHHLRFRNNDLLRVLDLDPYTVTDEHFIEAFGQFHCVRPFLAWRYHGYQFGEYNPYLGDGRGFVYGQVRGKDDTLYDFGTKGSGRTPYSRNADGRLTLKGGMREVLAAEMLHRLGVHTSRCLSFIETGEALWRGDEPSPTRSSVIVRMSRSHIRFGTFERLHYFQRGDLVKKLLDHVIEFYYSTVHLKSDQIPERYCLFYQELVKRIAAMVAQWMAAGFCHGVLNTDNMSITGESFDYGPYAFIPTYNPRFTAAYFDYSGLYAYGQQPFICKLNLERLQKPLSMVMDQADLNAGLMMFDDQYRQTYCQLMSRRLGFESLPAPEAEELVKLTIEVLYESQISYHEFFDQLRQQFHANWRDHPGHIFPEAAPPEFWEPWRQLYYHQLQTVSTDELHAMQHRLQQYNPAVALVRPVIESVWEPIDQENNWQPFVTLVQEIMVSSNQR